MKIKSNLQIAIDGPVSSGKGTLALALSKKLNLLVIYTGAMYRTAAFIYLQNQNQDQPLSEAKFITILKSSQIKLAPPSKKNRYCDIILNNQNITNQLYTKEVNQMVPYVSKMFQVRKHLVSLQQKLAKNKAVVMEGRDIASKVLPNADLKIYLVANLETRAKRRYIQMKKNHKTVSLEKLKQHIVERDTIDSTRAASPLKPTPDAWIIDTSNLSVEETVEKVIKKLKNLELLKT